MKTVNSILRLSQQVTRAMPTSKPVLQVRSVHSSPYVRRHKFDNANASEERPIVLLLPWLNANQKHVDKYVALYHKKGYDVTTVSISASHFLWPQKSFAVVKAMCEELRSSEMVNRPILVHSFSVGSFLLSVLFSFMRKDLDKYEDISRRLIGFVADSITVGGTARMIEGIVISMNLPSVTKVVLDSYFKLTYPWTVKLYDDFMDSWINYPVKRSPTLYFFCGNDPMCNSTQMTEMIDYQRKQGYNVFFKYWEKSGHAQHYNFHKEAYEERLNEFLALVDPNNKKLCKTISPKL